MSDTIRAKMLKVVQSDLAFRLVFLVVLMLGIWAVVLGIQNGNTTKSTRELTAQNNELQKDQRELARRQVIISERQDCARKLSTEQTEVQRHMAALNGQGLADVAEGDTEALLERAVALRATALQLDSLRNLQELVDKQCPAIEPEGTP